MRGDGEQEPVDRRDQKSPGGRNDRRWAFGCVGLALVPSTYVADAFALASNADSPPGGTPINGTGYLLANLFSLLILAPPVGALLALLANLHVRVITELVWTSLGYAAAIAIIIQTFLEEVHR
jgi:hypothetical protein